MKTKIKIAILTITLFYAGEVRAIVWTEGYHQININETYFELEIINDVKLDIYGGEIYQLGTFNNTITNWYDGQMDYLLTNDNSIVNIFGGKLNSLLVIDENSRINLYAYNVTYNDMTRIIEGNYYYGDHSRFLIELSPRPDAYSHVTIIPEPSTLFLLGIGCLFLKNK